MDTSAALPPPHRAGPRAQALAALAVVAAVALLHAPTVRTGFVKWDDDLNIYENALLAPVTGKSFVDVWRHAPFHLYIPVTRTFWTAIAAVSSRGAAPGQEHDPRWFHAANVVLHAGNALLVGAILLHLLGATWPACAGALLFAVHPVQVEPVAWVTGAKDLLGVFFALLATWLHVRRQRGAFVAFVLALLSKPTTAVLPGMLVLLDVVFHARPIGRSLRALLACFAVAFAAILVNALVQPAPQSHVPIWVRPLVVADAVGWYLRKIVFPGRLGIDYGHSPAAVLAQRALWLALPVVAALGVAAWRWRRSVVVHGALLTLLAVSPTLGFIPFGFQDTSTVADRYLYLALLGPALVLAATLQRAKKRWAWPAALVVLGMFGTQSAYARRPWRDSLTLFEHAIEVNPRSRIGRFNLGMTLAERGRHVEASRELEALLRIAPEDALAHNALGRSLAARGDFEAAAAAFQKAIALEPRSAAMYFDLGNCRAAQQRLDAAAQAYRESLRLDPGAARTHYNLGLVLAASGDLEAAATSLSTAIQIDPGFEPARAKLGRVREQLEAGAPVATPQPSR